jgi:hypothetical protein
MTRRRELLARTAIVLLALLSTSCGAPAATAPTLVPAGQRSVEKDLQSTWEAIVGSSADRVAADQVTYVTHQKPIVGCMADHGYSYTPPPYISLIQRGTPTPIDRDYPALISLGIPQASGLDIAFQLSRAELAGSGVGRPVCECVFRHRGRRASDFVSRSAGGGQQRCRV